MPQLISTIEDLKRHIIVSATFDFKKVLPFAQRVERKIIIKQIGREQYNAIVDHGYEEDSQDPINLVRHLFEEAVANYALYLAMPTINLLITNSGTKSPESSQSPNADWKEKRDLLRSLIKTANEAIDDAFDIMEEHVDDFLPWENSNQYTVFKDLLVSRTSIFGRWFEINNSRQTFMAMKPLMREVEQQYLRGLLGDCTLTFLKKANTNPVVIVAQETAQRAVVALTVSKAAETGPFVFTDSAMMVATDELPWEKTKLELDEEKLKRLRKSRQIAGAEYLKELKRIVKSEPTIFDCYVDKEELVLQDKVIVKKSGLYL